MQRAKLPQQLLDGACTPAGAACSSALPGWVSPAGSICPASLRATQGMTAHLQSQPGYGAACYSVQKAPCMLCLGSYQLLKDLLQKAAPPHKTETVTLRAGGQSCSPHEDACGAVQLMVQKEPGWGWLLSVLKAENSLCRLAGLWLRGTDHVWRNHTPAQQPNTKGPSAPFQQNPLFLPKLGPSPDTAAGSTGSVCENRSSSQPRK